MGIAANRNHVAEAAIGDWIVFVDDDELPQSDWLSAMYREASTDDWDVIQGCVEPQYYPDSIYWYAPVVNSAGIICTANLAIRKSSLFAIGGFDNCLTTSHEDVELGCRIRSAGLRACFNRHARVVHPPRRMTFAQVIDRAIQQQSQSYLLHFRPPKIGWKCAHLILPWNLKYIYRTFIMQVRATGYSRWRLLFMHTLIRVFCCPVVCLRLIFTESR
jgi:hypothetical protein